MEGGASKRCFLILLMYEKIFFILYFENRLSISERVENIIIMIEHELSLGIYLDQA